MRLSQRLRLSTALPRKTLAESRRSIGQPVMAGREAIQFHERFPMHGGKIMLGLTAVVAPTIAQMAMQRLHDSPYKAMRRVSCECKHGVLFLRGRLFTFHEKQVAQETVAGVSGVIRVVNETEVE